MTEAAARHPARRARSVRVALARRRGGDGRRRARGRRRPRASRASSWPTTPSWRWPRRRRSSRAAGIKLANALDALGLDPAAGGRSTWAPPPAASPTASSSAAPQHVVALDVAYGELHWRLRKDPRVTVIERRNARDAAAGRAALRARPDRRSTSRSSRSRKAARRRARLRRARASTASRSSSRSSRSGASAWARAAWCAPPRIGGRRSWRSASTPASGSGRRCSATRRSGLPGPAGNRESFVWLAEAGRAGAAGDLEAAARRAEP